MQDLPGDNWEGSGIIAPKFNHNWTILEHIGDSELLSHNVNRSVHTSRNKLIGTHWNTLEHIGTHYPARYPLGDTHGADHLDLVQLTIDMSGPPHEVCGQSPSNLWTRWTTSLFQTIQIQNINIFFRGTL